MRFMLLFVFFFCLVKISLAEEVKLNQGENTSVGDHIVKVVNIGEADVIISVDGEKGIFSLNEAKVLNDVEIKVSAIFYVSEPEDRYVNLDLDREEIAEGTAEVGVCGNDLCEEDLGEDEESCCKDCGCGSGFSCVDNKCVENECNSDKECYDIPDRDFCIRYKCEGAPKKCTETAITECVVNDKCCPSSCFYPDDPDCPSTKKKAGGESISIGEQVEEEATVEESFFKRLFMLIKGLFGKIF
jgi:hypothetical protein